MTRRLVVTVPDVECVRCRTVAPGAVRYIHSGPSGEGLRADLAPPLGWVFLYPQHAGSSPENEPRIDRSFAICPACYPVGQSAGGRTVDAVYEARET